MEIMNDLIKNPKIKTTVVHSKSNSAYNIVSVSLGTKYKIARIPYLIIGDVNIDEREKNEALEHANFISECFNNSDKITQTLNKKILWKKKIKKEK